MTLSTFSFKTGPCTLPDTGKLDYNGCTFSPLFATTVNGVAVKDEAQRTVKFMEYAISADGYVTLPDGQVDISPTMDGLRRLLTAQGGALTYKGRGMDLVINAAGGGGVTDVAWGPVPELLEFQPLGAGRSAKVRWQVKTRIPEITKGQGAKSKPGADIKKLGATVGGIAAIPLLQFNYDTSVKYSEDGFSSIHIKGTLEIPLTRTPTQGTRTLTQTADDVRGVIDARVMRGIDLDRFRVTNREFNVSRDKRTMTWDITAEEDPYMDTPPDCTVARGTYSVKPAKAGMGLCTWLCTLRATYTVRNDRPRRTAWLAFLALLYVRMAAASKEANVLELPSSPQAPRRNSLLTSTATTIAPHLVLQAGRQLINQARQLRQASSSAAQASKDGRTAWLIDFNIDEGLYLDSKTVTFSATWRLVTTFSHILLASGLWEKVPEEDSTGQNLWTIAMRDIQGSQSWLANKLDPSLDVIVDFGS